MSMLIRILPNQVPKVWEQIKFAAVSVDRIEDRDRPLYLNRLLIALLNDKAQCFLRVTDNKQLLGVAITRILVDEITGEKSLFINCVYSFQIVSESQWNEDLEIIKKFAKRSGCVKLISYSNNRRVFEIVTNVGFKERYRCFAMNLEAENG